MDLTNKAWYRDNTGLYFEIELGPHTNNTYTQYFFGGFLRDTQFKLADAVLDIQHLLQSSEEIVSTEVTDFELDNQILAAGGSIPDNSLIRTGFFNADTSHYVSFNFQTNLDETMAGLYQVRFKVTTNQGRVFAYTFRIKITQTVADFIGHRDGFKEGSGQLHGII